MTISERQKLIIRAALSYVMSNLDDINDAFADDPNDGTCTVRVGGEIGSLIEEGEVQSLIDHFMDADPNFSDMLDLASMSDSRTTTESP